MRGLDVEIHPPINGIFDDECIKFRATSVGVMPIVSVNNIEYSMLVEQADRENHPWEIPSGRVEDEDENIFAAGQREFREETGLEVSVKELYPLTYAFKGDGKGGLLFFTDLDLNLSDYNIEGSSDDVIYLSPPPSVNRNEISRIALEPLARIWTKSSLLTTSAHPWAMKNIRRALAYKGYNLES